MKASRLRRGALVFAAVFALTAVAAALVIPRLIDPESYRGLLQSSLERRLEREVSFGAMEVSLWPLFGLRLDDVAIGAAEGERVERPLVAERLSLGARLWPLLRGRLEVTSLLVEGPELTLYRGVDGGWEPRLPEGDAGEAEADGPTPFVVERLELTRGRVVLRSDEGEAALDELTLSLDGFGSGEALACEFAARLDAAATLRGEASIRPGEAPSVATRVQLEGVAASTLGAWLPLVDPGRTLPDGLLDDRPFSVAASIEASGGRVAVSDFVVEGLGLTLVRSASGDWNHASLFETSGEAAAGTSSSPVELSGLSLRDASLRLEDRTGNTTRRLELGALNLTLDQLPTEAAATVALDARVGSGGRLEVRGTVGPIPEDPTMMPIELALALGELPLRELGGWVPAIDTLDLAKASTAADLQLAGTLATKLDVRGSASLTDAVASFVSPHGERRALPLDVVARGHVALGEGARRVELSDLELELPRRGAGRTLTLRGAVDLGSAPARVDVALLPTRVPADELAALATLFAADTALAFASPDPVELELRARGPLGPGVLPELEGRATLSGFTFRVAGMKQPMEGVGARVQFSGREVTLDALEGRIGASDVTASRVVVSDFAAPRVRLELVSTNADFWELFSFIDSAPAAPRAPTAGSATSGPGPQPATPLERLTVDGTLRLERGSLGTLAFERLATPIDYRAGLLTLAPLEMQLYGGSFAGKLAHDLGANVLTIGGSGSGIDADAFLAANLGLGGLISGRTTSELDLRVSLADPANLLAGVSGGGPVRIVDGRLAKLDVMKTLSRVSGIFGEQSLRRLTGQLATAGTGFRRVETRLGFDAGTLRFEDLVIETDELTLAGRASLDSATGVLDGRFVVAIAPELSATMREERSRAASLFWEPKSQRVRFGFDVAGPATAPKVSVDWEGAVRGVTERKLEERLRELIDRKRRPAGGEPAAEPTAGTPPPAQTSPETPIDTAAGTTPDAASDTAAPPSEGPAADPEGPVVEITRTRWGGPVLARDLTVEGTVRGEGIARASLEVVDARGIRVQKIDALPLVAGESGASASWRAEIDGKRFLPARFPVRVVVTVVDREGRSVSASREVER